MVAYEGPFNGMLYGKILFLKISVLVYNTMFTNIICLICLSYVCHDNTTLFPYHSNMTLFLHPHTLYDVPIVLWSNYIITDKQCQKLATVYLNIVS